jgi:hypothetical protein
VLIRFFHLLPLLLEAVAVCALFLVKLLAQMVALAVVEIWMGLLAALGQLVKVMLEPLEMLLLATAVAVEVLALRQLKA